MPGSYSTSNSESEDGDCKFEDLILVDMPRFDINQLELEGGSVVGIGWTGVVLRGSINGIDVAVKKAQAGSARGKVGAELISKFVGFGPDWARWMCIDSKTWKDGHFSG